MSCTSMCLFSYKKCTCRTGINISRQWFDQAPKNIDLYRCFSRFPGLWLVTVPLICLAHEDHLSYPQNGKGIFTKACWFILSKICCLTATFSWNVWQDMVSNRRNIETLANLVSINQSSTSLGQRKTSLTMAFDYRSVSGFFCGRIDSIWCFLVIPGEWIWITCLSKDCTIHFLKKTWFISGPPFLKPFFLGNIFYCSYDGITGHFLDPKWWIVLSCTCLFKKYMSKTSIHPFRKWIAQSNKTSNFTWFLHFLGFWLGQNFSI